MTRRLWGALAIVLALMMLAVVPVTAVSASPNLQEATPLPDGELIVVTWQGLAALIGIALTVGLTGGVGGALLIVRAVRQNETITYAMERLYLSTPPETQKQIRNLVELFMESGYLLEDVTDGEMGIPTKEVPQDESDLARIQRE